MNVCSYVAGSPEDVCCRNKVSRVGRKILLRIIFRGESWKDRRAKRREAWWERGKGKKEIAGRFYSGTKTPGGSNQLMGKKGGRDGKGRERRRNRGSECLSEAGQCVNVAGWVAPRLPPRSHIPREAINKEIMAKLFSQRLCVSLMLFKCANHFFHYCTGRERERERERRNKSEPCSYWVWMMTLHMMS